MKRIVIIGGGAAGMMAAATLAELKMPAQITLVERNPRLGQKVIISGGGRCNVTTGVEELKEVIQAYPRGARFLRTALYEFSPSDMKAWVQSHGVPLKTEEDLRVFPKSNKGTHVVRIFEQLLEQSKVQVLCKRVVTRVEKDELFKIHLNTDEVLEAEALVLTTGGQAYQRTGSKGDGYSFAQALGHQITPLAPSLTAFTIEGKAFKHLAGLSFEKVGLKLHGKEKHEFSGPILFTHKGLTGPAIFALSALSAFESLPLSLDIDFFPDLNQEQLRLRWTQILESDAKKHVKNLLGYLLPNSFAASLLEQLTIDPSKPGQELSKKEKNQILHQLKHFSVTLVGRSPGEEFVTAGGVELSEVDKKRFESKLTPGLFFAGEILNIDGFTGGYNLQAAWSGGRAVGRALGQDLH